MVQAESGCHLVWSAYIHIFVQIGIRLQHRRHPSLRLRLLLKLYTCMVVGAERDTSLAHARNGQEFWVGSRILLLILVEEVGGLIHGYCGVGLGQI